MLRRILNSGQNANNLLKLNTAESPCCGDGATDCQYTATYPTANSISAITIHDADGVNQVRTISPAVSGGAANVLAALRSALAAAGFEEIAGQFEGITVTPVSTNLQVVLTGDVVGVSITHSGGTATFDGDCTLTNLCTFSAVGFAGGATNNLRINGVDYALGAVTAGTTSAADVKTAIEGAMTSAGVTGTVAVTTVGSGGSQTYSTTITVSDSDNTYILAGVYLDRSACVATWI